VETVENPRWFKTNQERLVSLDRAVSSKRRGGKNWRKACAVRGAFKAKVARQRHDFQHKLSAEIASRCAIFVTEKLSIKNMMASVAGTAEEPGRNVAQKSGLNREIGDTGGASLFQKLAYKVPETGAHYLEAPTKTLKPSQRCPECPLVVKKVLALRWHVCAACGHEEDRDCASARVMLRWALGTLPAAAKKSKIRGQELPKAAYSRETPSNRHTRIGGGSSFA
jgi:putative transposase